MINKYFTQFLTLIALLFLGNGIAQTPNTVLKIASDNTDIIGSELLFDAFWQKDNRSLSISKVVPYGLLLFNDGDGATEDHQFTDETANVLDIPYTPTQNGVLEYYANDFYDVITNPGFIPTINNPETVAFTTVPENVFFGNGTAGKNQNNINLPLNFTFEFFGTGYTEISISENGYLFFGAVDPGVKQFSRSSENIIAAYLPTTNGDDFTNTYTPSTILAGFNTGNESSLVNYEFVANDGTNPAHFIIEWEYPNNVFRIALFEDNSIYIKVDEAEARNHLVGLQESNDLFAVLHHSSIAITNPGLEFLLTRSNNSVNYRRLTGLVNSDWNYLNSDVDNNWNDPNNWDFGTPTPSNGGAPYTPGHFLLPSPGDAISIPNLNNYYPSGLTINLTGSNGNINTLSLESGVTLNIGEKITLNYNSINSNGFTDGGNLILQNGASIVPIDFDEGEVSLTTVVNRIKNSPLYSFMGSPVQDQSFSGFGSGDILTLRPGTSSNPQQHFIEPETPNFVPGQGYAVLGSNTYNFTGIPNNGTVAVPVENKVEDEIIGEGGLNFISNPYPSAIRILDFLSSNNSVLEQGAIYIADQTARIINPDEDRKGNIIVVNATGSSVNPDENYKFTFNFNENPRLPAGQAVQVLANNNGNAVFNNSMRRAELVADDFRDDTLEVLLQEAEHLWVEVEQDSAFSSILVSFGEQATDTADYWYDARKVGQFSNLDLATFYNQEYFMINTFNNETDSLYIPIHVKFPKAGQAKLRTSALKDIRPDRNLYLYDTQRDIYTSLAEPGDSIEVFVPMAGFELDRFVLVSLVGKEIYRNEQKATSVNTIEKVQFTAYGHIGQVIMESEISGTAQILNLQGQFVGNAPIQQGANTMDLNNGAYIVRFVSHDQTVVRTNKVIVR